MQMYYHEVSVSCCIYIREEYARGICKAQETSITKQTYNKVTYICDS